MGERGIGGVADDPDVSGPDGGGQGLAGLVDHLGGEPGRQAKAHSLAGGNEFGAFDPRDQATRTDELAGDQHPVEPAAGRPVPQASWPDEP